MALCSSNTAQFYFHIKYFCSIIVIVIISIIIIIIMIIIIIIISSIITLFFPSSVLQQTRQEGWFKRERERVIGSTPMTPWNIENNRNKTEQNQIVSEIYTVDLYTEILDSRIWHLGWNTQDSIVDSEWSCEALTYVQTRTTLFPLIFFWYAYDLNFRETFYQKYEKYVQMKKTAVHNETVPVIIVYKLHGKANWNVLSSLFSPEIKGFQ